MKLLRRRRLSVRTHIALLAAGLALLSMAAGTAVVAYYAMQSAEAELGRRALTIGRTMAEITDVKRQVGQPNGQAIIQPIAERVRMANGAAYVVVLDMAHRRLSHPVESRIGTMHRRSGPSGKPPSPTSTTSTLPASTPNWLTR